MGHLAISQFVSRCTFRQSFPGAIIHNGVLVMNAMVTVAGACRDRQCATVTPKVTTVDLREP